MRLNVAYSGLLRHGLAVVGGFSICRAAAGFTIPRSHYTIMISHGRLHYTILIAASSYCGLLLRHHCCCTEPTVAAPQRSRGGSPRGSSIGRPAGSLPALRVTLARARFTARPPHPPPRCRGRRSICACSESAGALAPARGQATGFIDASTEAGAHSAQRPSSYSSARPRHGARAATPQARGHTHAQTRPIHGPPARAPRSPPRCRSHAERERANARTHTPARNLECVCGGGGLHACTRTYAHRKDF